MPSDLKAGSQDAAKPSAPGQNPAIEPPSIKLIVRLFLIPLLIAGAVVGIMIPIGRMAGGAASFEQAMERLKNPGGEKTFGLVGPGAKQRYLDAKALVDHMKAGLDEPQRIVLAKQLIDLLEQYTRPEEGEVQHFVMLALGRVWQVDPRQGPMDSPAAVESRQQVVRTLMSHFDAPQVPARKAAILALSFWTGREEARAALPALIGKLGDQREDIDVRMAAAVAVGSLAKADDTAAIDALETAMNDTEPRNAEISWNAALSLARLNQANAAPNIMKLLQRSELAKLKVFDRETDPKNPVFRTLNELEQERFLINTMDAAKGLEVAQVRQQLEKIRASDPSSRVRAAAVQVLGGASPSAG
jgi:hypothetical protein